MNDMTTTQIIVQLITGMLGSLGFSLLFGLRKRYLVSAAFGGFLNWGLYLLGMHWWGSIFFAGLLASAASALYSEVMARVQKAPSTLFFITSVIPLIPGSTLYYACSNAVVSNWEQAKYFANRTLQYSLAIAAGACIIWAITFTIENVKRHKKSK
ncbi:MAG: threonine/serine exporter family protein [Clostridia bacterium]|nr:threonine/serine exporter family protein [Clostridia bacterium]